MYRFLFFFLLASTWPPNLARRRTRIKQGGAVPNIESYPFNVKLAGVHCSGSIISPHMVLTAAHCICGKPLSSITITVGSTLADGRRPLEIPATRGFLHPYFANCTLTDNYDMAIVYTARPIPFSRYVNKIPICSSRCFRSGMMGMFMGYGDTHGHGKAGTLHYGQGRVSQCQQRFCVKYKRRNRHGALQTGSAITYGDSGGPLVVQCPMGYRRPSLCQLAIGVSGDLKNNMFFVQVYSLYQFPQLIPYLVKSPNHRNGGSDDDDDR